MQSCEYVSFITALACAVSKCCTKEELPLLAAAFSKLGDTLATMIEYEALCDSRKEEDH